MNAQIDQMAKAGSQAVRTGTKFQGDIRGYIADELEHGQTDGKIATDIADVVTLLRSDLNEWLAEPEKGTDEYKLRQKQFNNVINDVSRLCKKALGHSIKCTQRSPVHFYEAAPVVPPTLVAAEPEPWEEPIAHAAAATVDAWAEVSGWMKNCPEAVIERLCEHHPLDDIARLVLDKMKEKKGYGV
jgi:hypothetical protein